MLSNAKSASNRQKIIPHLWFNNEAKDAADFYTSVFPNSKVTNLTTLHNTPSGDCDVVSFDLQGFSFMAISAGPLFKFNPSISFMVNFDPSQDKDAEANLNNLWEKLVDGGKILMEIGTYPFSKRYGWLQDKYGLSWQLILTDPTGEVRPSIIPSIMFIGDMCGKAEEAGDFYLSVFKNAKRGTTATYPAGMEPDKEGSVMFSDFMLEHVWFVAMDSAHKHDFALNEAMSFIVTCENQEEIDYFWEKLSTVPESEQCGWLKDKYNVSWQIVPKEMNEMMTQGTREQIDRVTQTFLPMKKLEVQKLLDAYEKA